MAVLALVRGDTQNLNEGGRAREYGMCLYFLKYSCMW